MTEIRDIIDTLTQPHDVEIRDHGRTIGWRTQPGLITQLRTNIAGTGSTGDGGTPTADHARTILNTGASELYTAIEKRIRRWAHTAGYNPGTHGHTDWPTPEQLLRIWYATTYQNPHLDSYTATLTGWITAIHTQLDPPSRFDIDRPCPICKAHIIETNLDGETIRIRALTTIVRHPATNSIATCRNCNTTWTGLAAIEELAQELHEQHA